MSTRQIRISNSNQIRNRIGEFQGKKINIVLHDGNVFLGTLLSISETGITIIGMSQNKMSFELSKINEIYFDTIV